MLRWFPSDVKPEPVNEQCEPPAIRRSDWLVAAVVAFAALGIYLKTLFPGLGGGGDSAKFQYVGSVLGTPHPPGYPLYVFVSFCFAHIPIGSLAWRINAMSAFFATVAALLSFVVLRRLGIGRTIAAAVALALAFDQALWAFAVRAEVYTLTGALTALLLLCAVRWQHTRRERELYLMVAVFALSLGNHLTAAAMAPAIVAFVFLTDRRAITVRTAAISSAIVLAGLCQYGFILLRTAQDAPYLEARAGNLRELFAVMRATRFSDQIFAFSPHQLIVERAPELWHLSVAELNPFGVVLVGAGLIALVVRRIRLGIFLVLGAAAIMFLTLNVGATDVEGFLIPAFLLIWIIIGIGLRWLAGLANSVARHGGLACVALALALPSLQVTRNYRPNDHHRRTYEIRYFDALFRQFESRSAIVTESYAIDQLVLYKLAGERAAGARTIELISRDSETVRQRATAGFTTYAFADGRRALESNGFRFEPMQLSSADSPSVPPIDMSPLPLFRLAKLTSCQDIGNAGWQDITNIARDGRLLLRIDNYRPFDSVVVLYAGQRSGAGVSPLLAASHGPEAPSMAVAIFRAADSSKLAAAEQRDAVVKAEQLGREESVQRIELKVNDRGDFSWSALDLGGHQDIVLARASVDLNNPRRASFCGWSGRDLFESGLDERVPFGSSGENSFGAGWHGAERSTDGVDFRWTSAREAEVLVPLTKIGTITVRVRASPFTYSGSPPQALALKINGDTLAARPMQNGWSTYEWTVPASTWRQGFNRLVVRAANLASPAAVGASSDTRTLGVAVSDLSFRLTSVDEPRVR